MQAKPVLSPIVTGPPGGVKSTNWDVFWKPPKMRPAEGSEPVSANEGGRALNFPKRTVTGGKP